MITISALKWGEDEGSAHAAAPKLRYDPALQAMISTDWFIEARGLAARATAILNNHGVRGGTLNLPGGKLVLDE